MLRFPAICDEANLLVRYLGCGGTAGLVINGTNAADLVVVSYGATNTSATSTAAGEAETKKIAWPPASTEKTENAKSAYCMTRLRPQRSESAPPARSRPAKGKE